MPIAITATGTSLDPAITSAIAHATHAARACLDTASIDPGTIGLLIHIGIYRDDNLIEPSIAALIQQRLGIHPEYLTSRTPHPPLSFDLMNGTAGLLTAIHLATAFLSTDRPGHALITSASAHPSGRQHPDFPYASCGAAMLLTHHPHRPGFGPITFTTKTGTPEPKGYLDLATMATNGRTTITTASTRAGQRQIADQAAALAHALLNAEAVEPTQVQLITTPTYPAFSTDVASRIGIQHDSAITATGFTRSPHASALIIAYHQAFTSGRRRHAKPILFLDANSACVLYRHHAQ